MKKRLLRLCSIVLIISMVLGNVVSLAADDTTSTGTESTGTTGMSFSENLKGVIDKPFDSSIKTVEATICLPTELPEDASNYSGVILGMYGANSLPCLSFEIYTGGYPCVYYWNNDTGAKTRVIFNTNITKGEVTHLAFVLEESENGTIVSCYVDGQSYAPMTSNPQLGVTFEQPTIAYCVGGDYRTDPTNSWFKGEIYSLAVYSGAREVYSELDSLTDDQKAELTEEDIKAQLAVDTSDTGLMAYYDLTTVDASTTKVNNDATANQGTYNLNLIETWMDTRRPALNEEDITYSIALVGDTQIATEYDVMNNQANENGVVAGIYQWLLEHKEEKNIQFVMGLGDIVQGEDTYALYQNTTNASVVKTDEVKEAEWTYAMKQIQTLDDKIPYSLIRGNHDPQDEYIQHVTQAHYAEYIDGALDETMLNTWQELIVGDIKYLIMSLDLGASDTELKWAEEVIKTHPNHNVIISTHAYLNDDGTTLDANDAYHPDQYNKTGSKYPDAEHNRNNGDEMWENYFKKYDNIVMIVSGHIGSDDIIMTQAEGVNGNKVAQMLVNPQDLDFNLAKLTNTTPQSPTGMICLLNFSADGKTVQVEQYSTDREQHYMSTSQFTFEMNVVEEQKLLFNTQQMPRHTAKDWFAKDGTSYSLATYTKQAIVSANTTNIISYSAPSDGFIRITDMKVGFYGDAQSGGYDTEGNAREFEFAVTNENGEILSNYGDVLLFNPNRTLETGLFVEEYEIQKGESIYFVIHGNAGSGNLVQCTPNIEFRVDSSDEWECVSSLSTIVPWPKATTWTDANAVQGMGGFYYHYSNSYEKVACVEYDDKLILNTKPMTYTSGDTWPFTSDNSNCKTRMPEIVAGTGTTNVISYQAASDGYIWIDEMRVWQVTAATGCQVDFAVVNETGKVLTNNGEIYAVTYSLNSQAKANLENLVMTKQEIKKGERIYFVFRGIEGVTSVRCSANVQFCAEGDTVGSMVNIGTDYNYGMSLRKTGVTADNIAQGTGDGDFFYEYSNVYEKVESQKPEYLHVEPTEMTSSFVNSDNLVTFPFMQNSHCRTSYNQIIVSAGYTNIISYKAAESGTICIDEMQVWIANYNHAGKYKIAFSIIDKDGKILTNNGEQYIVSDSFTDVADATANADNLVLPKVKLEAGESIYFVFHGLLGTTPTLRCNAKILFDKASDDKLNTFEPIQTEWHDSNMTLYSKENYKSGSETVDIDVLQGKGNFYYMYSTQNTTNPSGVTIGDEIEGVVTIYEPVDEGQTYGDKYITEITTNTDGTKSYSYIDLDMLNVKQQSKIHKDENGNDTDLTDIRFIASVDNLSYQKVGFLFTKDADVVADKENLFVVLNGDVGIPEKANKSNTKVYTKMLEYDTYRKASNIYADDGCNTAYAFAFEMTDIPANQGTIYVRAYVLLDDGVTYVYGEPRAIDVTAAGTVN